MTFLHATLAAAGIACIAIPIIIHLLMHRRRKPVMWGAMRFLLEAYRRQRRRLMLEKWLLLLCRCLVIALLGMAIGRPLIGKLLGPGSGRTLYILIDNSLTSGLRGPDGRTALERHKATAKAAIEAVRSARTGALAAAEGDRVALITLGGPADPVIMPPSADLAAVARLIDELQPTDSRADFAGGLQLVADSFSGAAAEGEDRSLPPAVPANTYVSLISDFREGSLDVAPGAASSGPGNWPKLPDGVHVLATIPAADAPPRPNIAISGVEPLRAVVVAGSGAPGETADAADDGGNLVRVMLRRSGGELPAAASTVETRIVWTSGPRTASNDAARPESSHANVKWAPGQDSAMAVVSLPPMSLGSGPAAASASAFGGAILVSIDDDPLAADNTWRRPVEFRESLRVGVIAPTRFASGGVSADRLDPGTWARIALAPGGDGEGASGGIEVIDIEPASIDAARLAGLDAVIIPRPDLLQDAGWSRVGLFASSGGVVFIMPPPDVSVHLWPDAMIRGLALPPDWTIGRESRKVEGAHFVASNTAEAPSGGSSTSSPIAASLLALVEGELDGLLRPVNLRLALPIDNTADAGQSILKLDNGATVMWAGRPGAVAGSTESRGLVVYLGVALSLDWSDMPAKPLMVPLMQEIVRQGVGQARGSWWMLAGGRPSAPAGTAELRPVDDRAADARRGGNNQPIATETITLNPAQPAAPLRHSATYAAVDARGATRATIAVNPDPRAGRVPAQPREAVASVIAAAITPPAGAGDSPDAATRAIVWLPGDGASLPTATEPGGDTVQSVMSGLFGSSERGSPIELPLLIAALVLAIVEIGLARWASHAEVLPAAVRQAAGAVSAVVPGASRSSGEAA